LPVMPTKGDELTADLVEAIRLLVDAFAAKSIRYAIVGGVATSLRSRPRFTQDVDVLLEVPQIVLPGLLDELANRGFNFDSAKVIREFVQEHLTVFYYKSVRIDWIKPVLPLYAKTLSDASLLVWKSGQSLRVAEPEGLILTKMVAFRLQDQLDIESLLVANRDHIDLDLIRHEWLAVSAGEDARTAWLENAIARLTLPKT
jgi:hypothetical protein